MPVIEVRDLSKKYRLGASVSHDTLRDTIAHAASALFRGNNTARASEKEILWALKDVSFEVSKSEVLGIIGRNGAGKSTLLKILSRITAPTGGIVKIKGKVGSLLEVGTGFHPELSGRENIYLNGAILGMSRVEIKSKFDEIVAFAEMERFLDTPVKRYSSGMYVRLAFAVAAHLEPEILIVDEVLAVGDMAFQKKCLGKMSDMTSLGRTILFVSHNLQAIRNLCTRAIVIDEGRIVSDATTTESLHAYNKLLREVNVTAETAINDYNSRRGSGKARISAIAVKDSGGADRYNFSMGETVKFELSYKTYSDISGLYLSIGLRSGLTNEMVSSIKHPISKNPLKAGTEGTVVVELPEIYIRPGEYPLYFWLGGHLTKAYDILDNITPPLVITVGDKYEHYNVNPLNPTGYFSMPSTIHNLKESRG